MSLERVVISGADGFIGGALANAFASNGTDVIALVYSKTHCSLVPSQRLHIVECQMKDYDLLPSLLSSYGSIDVFYHYAWQGYGADTNNPLIQFQNVSWSTIALNSAAILACRKFVFAGSSHEFLRYIDQGRGNEIIPSVYGVAKHSAHEVLAFLSQTKHIDYCSSIFTNIFGPGDRSNRTTNFFIRTFLKGESPKLTSGEHYYDWTYIDDCVKGLILIGEKGINQKRYYIGSSHPLLLKNIVTQVKNIVNPNVKLAFGGYPEDSFIDYSLIDLAGSKDDLGFSISSSFDRQIEDTVEWIKKIDTSGAK